MNRPEANPPTQISLNDPNSGPASTAVNSATVVVIPSNAVVGNILTGLTSQTNPDATVPLDQDVTDATVLERDDWLKILARSSVLKAWKGNVQANEFHVIRAPCPAIAMKTPAQNSQGSYLDLPVFEIADSTYIETRESKTRLEREMTQKAFTETGIHTALQVSPRSGGASGVELGLGYDVKWQNEQNASTVGKNSTTTVHGFYNFPRVILHLYPESFEISPQGEQFFAKNYVKTMEDFEKSRVLREFYDRFGSILPTRVTLGGRLCTTQEVRSADSTEISQVKKDIQVQLAATVKAAGAGLDSGFNRRKGSEQGNSATQANETTRMVLETQGGNGLTASVDDWRTSVASYRYWRAIQQEQPEDLLTFLSDVTAGTRTGEHVLALANYARQGNLLAKKFKDEEQERRRLKISARLAFSPTPEYATAFQGVMILSRPEVLREIRIYGLEYKSFGKQEVMLFLFERDQVKSSCNINIPIVNPGNFRNIRMPQAQHLVVELELEDHLSWSEHHVEHTRRLEWPDVETHPTWEGSFLVYDRKPQNGFQGSEQATELPVSPPLPGNEASSGKRPNMIKRILNQ